MLTTLSCGTAANRKADRGDRFTNRRSGPFATASTSPARVVANKRGYLWGSYHWGLASNSEKQAEHYINTVKPAPDELIALNLEDATSRTLMNADEVLLFICRVKQLTGRYPVLYANHASAKLISVKFKNSEFSLRSIQLSAKGTAWPFTSTSCATAIAFPRVPAMRHRSLLAPE